MSNLTIPAGIRHTVPMADGSMPEPDDSITAMVRRAWLDAQHDVAPRPAPAPVTAGPFDAFDAWAGDLSEVHAFLTANPAF